MKNGLQVDLLLSDSTLRYDYKEPWTTGKRPSPPIIDRANLVKVNIEIAPTQDYAQVKETLWFKKYPDQNLQGGGTEAKFIHGMDKKSMATEFLAKVYNPEWFFFCFNRN